MSFHYLLYYLIMMNVIAFFAFRHDKRAAEKHQQRIRNRTLILLAVIGGSIGALAGMRIYHHKTKQALFYIGIPIVLVVQIIVVFFIRSSL